MEIEFRKAEKKDISLIFSFIRELARYEKLSSEVTTDEETLERYLFGERRYAEIIFAIVDNSEAGFVLFYHNFSTFIGKPGIYIEDLYVKPEIRGKGVGKALLSHISQLALERKCGRVEWSVLNWNPARQFYESIGAKVMDEWMVYRLNEIAINNLAADSNI
ncbi:MAG: GNAT family N-acetyltransferase [Bacteroidales bacterium]|nr:GNAT family N-acetyltransferase [Bacteroidales bacterium]